MRFLKDLFFGGFSFLGLPRDRAVILMYHSVSARTDYFMNVEPEDFERQMKFISDSGRPVVALSELIRRLKAGESLGGAVVITLDDGYRDNYEIAFPILKQYNFRATIFVTTDLIGKTDTRNVPRLTVEQMKEMESSGLIDIEPHTKTHPKLSELTEEGARSEMAGSRDVLEGLFGKKARLFAYPYGNYNTLVRGIAAREFDGAVTVTEHTVSATSKLFELPRVSIDSSTTSAQFKGKITRAVDVYSALKV